METIEFTVAGNLTLCADIHLAAAARRERVVLYFHGGGLLCGTRDDLPLPYIRELNAQGYDLICFDYPLAPESSLAEIHEAVYGCLTWFLANRERALWTGKNGYFLFGRSAGAYLALLLADRIRREGLPMPAGILCFYGYSGFDIPEFSKPSAHYAKFLPADKSVVERVTKKSGRAVTYGPLSERYLLYIYARQTGAWTSLLGETEENLERFSLSPDSLALLPPTFLTASSTDPDVPFRVSKCMARAIPQSRFHPVYNLEHDFDRDTSRPEGPAVYKEAVRWMNER